MLRGVLRWWSNATLGDVECGDGQVRRSTVRLCKGEKL